MEDAILLKILEAQREILAELRLLRQAVTAGQPLAAAPQARQARPQTRPAAPAAPAVPQAAPAVAQAAAPRQATPAQRQSAATQTPATPRPATTAAARPTPAAQPPEMPPADATVAPPPQAQPPRVAPPQPEPSLTPPPVEAESAPTPEAFEEPAYAAPEPRRQRSSSTLTLNELTDLGEQFLDPEQRSRPRVKPVDAADLSGSILDDIKAKNRAKRSAFAEFEKFSKDR